jgi:hypothetical protein
MAKENLPNATIWRAYLFASVAIVLFCSIAIAYNDYESRGTNSSDGMSSEQQTRFVVKGIAAILRGLLKAL